VTLLFALACATPAPSPGSPSETPEDPSSPTDATTAESTGTGSTGETGSTIPTGPTCDDGVKDQDESAPDCGGSCGPCADGLSCASDEDCLAGTCDDLVCGHKAWGTWGLGTNGNADAYAAFLPAMNGFHFRVAWADFEPVEGGYEDAALEDLFAQPVADGLRVGFMVLVAPASEGTTPSWLFDPPWSVPEVETDREMSFPYYFDPGYLERYFAMLDAVRTDAANWDPATQAAVMFWQSAEGSTGDEGPYKGDPLDETLDISNPDWDDFKRDEVWTPLYADLAADAPWLHLMVNPGNDGSNFDWALTELPGAWLKAGNFTHAYDFPGEGTYALRLQGLRAGATDENRVRGELEGVTDLPWWYDHAEKNTFALLCSALHAGVDTVDLSPSTALPDLAPYVFFDRYAGIRRAEDGNVGFVALRDAIDLADLARFPEAVFGDLVAPEDRDAYDLAVAKILASGDPQAVIDHRLADLLANGKDGLPYVDPARIASLEAAYPDARYEPIELDVDSWDQDFGVDLIPGDYSLFVTQARANETSRGVWRVGPDDSMFGRFGRRFDPASGADRMSFAVDPGLLPDDGVTRLRVTVTYLDDGDGSWQLAYWDGAGERVAGTVTDADTGGVLTATFEVDAVGGGHLVDATDLGLVDASGDPSVFFLVEVERIRGPG
jgi:hypothetical protein